MSAVVEQTWPDFDPCWELLPEEQRQRVFAQEICDIDAYFLGFTEIYFSLAKIIPLHWTIVDLGCAYAPQAFIFKDHARYVGVDLYVKERFEADNSQYYTMPIKDFCRDHIAQFDQKTTFAICSYVPPWHADNRKIARESFENCFVYYPAGNPQGPYVKARK